MLNSTNPWGASSSDIYREAREVGVAQTVAKYVTARLVRDAGCGPVWLAHLTAPELCRRLGLPVGS